MPDQPDDLQNALEHNIGRLLRDAYQPEGISGDVRHRLTHAMHAVAANQPRQALDRDVIARIALAERWRGALRGAIAAAVVMGLGFAAMWAVLRPAVLPGPMPQEPVTMMPAVATSPAATVGFVRLAVDAKWDQPIRLGDRLSVGRVKLEEGLAQIIFDKGALVNLTGPAELDIKSDEHCVLLSGQLTADVAPDAVGFIVDTPDRRLIDRGTRFGIRVNEKAGTEVHVFEGRVDLAQKKDSTITGKLETGEALHLARDGQDRRIVTDASTFIQGEDLFAQFEAKQRGSHDRWLQDRRRWIEDPATVLYMDFAVAGERTLQNASDQTAPAMILGSAPRWDAGRWPAKRVMTFDGRTDHAQIDDAPALNLTGDFTVAMWIRMDAVPYRGWTRIVGKGKGLDRNYGVWINPSRRLLWQVCPDKKPFNWGAFNLETEPLESGRWYWAVGVVRGDENLLYLDGKQVAHRGGQERPVSRTGEPLTIGHYYDDVPGHTGFFAGAMDELVILRRALSETEIANAFAAGRPADEVRAASAGSVESPK